MEIMWVISPSAFRSLINCFAVTPRNQSRHKYKYPRHSGDQPASEPGIILRTGRRCTAAPVVSCGTAASFITGRIGIKYQIQLRFSSISALRRRLTSSGLRPQHVPSLILSPLHHESGFSRPSLLNRVNPRHHWSGIHRGIHEERSRSRGSLITPDATACFTRHDTSGG